ncbi:putative phage-associated protein [Microbacterium halimionae]|uniref:Putative phage-associated protein n=1 Tax=Microbacterium halimionae TaxID=1526413 RepID=A0A7W3PKZ0_9MICO|nr:type II toxin-antitoxin system antitoxin SocA domain-containing protein [Microbacterium halimionae]MBA8815638.1 putative phage-associated protein [Microbacterium halimionae]NII95685.1 putative phage-associated protein [Microbacterium halimionae]
MPYSPINVSNNILKRAFQEKVDVSPMKLQKLLFFVASEYAKRTGKPMIDGNFQAWQYGPVVRSVYDEFRSFGGRAIRSYGKDAEGKSYQIKEASDPALHESLDVVWNAAKNYSAVALSRITHIQGSAWANSFSKSTFIPEEALKADQTYRSELGLPEIRNPR